ncbi:hypothetical protein [Kitasatospora griseola]|uniref:hypothetical protein n=1 Tax=Kitasatospora griseola TaxID=2064 RepID=UPI00166FEC29|nr:hypothetical protein [Kitasatospora griseola]
MSALPFAWSGAQWVTPAGELRDLPLVRRGMGEWLAAAVAELDTVQVAADKVREDLRIRLSEAYAAMDMATSDEEFERAYGMVGEVRRLLDFEASREVLARDLPLMHGVRAISSELLSATTARVSQLLSLASQFEEFRAPLRDPAEWVARLGAAPRTEHVRTALVWDAFTLAEPALATSLGTPAGKRLLFAAMDRRFGARRKFGGYDGWRGVALAG